jgi:hypothetical protein
VVYLSKLCPQQSEISFSKLLIVLILYGRWKKCKSLQGQVVNAAGINTYYLGGYLELGKDCKNVATALPQAKEEEVMPPFSGPDDTLGKVEKCSDAYQYDDTDRSAHRPTSLGAYADGAYDAGENRS